MVHELLQTHSILAVAVRVYRVRRKRDTEPEQSGSDDAIGGVVIQLAPRLDLGQLSALESDRIDRVIAHGDLVGEILAAGPAPLESFRKHAVDVLPGPLRRVAFEAGVIEENPIIQIHRIFERTSVE